MKFGIAGFPGSGKTTIFNALTGLHADVGLGASSSGKANLGVIKVPDARVDALSAIFSPKKTTYAEMTFVDFPDPPSQGGRLDERVIAQMREVEALAHVVRAFDDPAQPAPDPVRALESFRTELVVADLAILERRIERVKRERGKERERELLERLVAALESEKELRHLGLAHEEETSLAGFQLLTLKPRLVVLNVNEGDVAKPPPAAIAEAVERDRLQLLVISGKVEMEISELDADDRRSFEAELGLAESARDRFIQASYRLLNLMSFLTAGEDEVRAWTIRRGDHAVVAAGKIHSDIARGFIRAEVIPFPALAELKSEARCREAGKLRLEGKDYVVQDGDVIHFRFNV
ncbi:MAG TPA: redox-regulated ATPase YchF [Candidatus Binatia bacterium]|nr:redox-regulated ATPase YchF [Candidatus Binatia bacterium]